MSEILSPEDYEREWWDILETRQRGYESFDAVNPETKAVLMRHDAALRSEVERLTRERDEAIRTVKALTPAANHCLQYKPMLLKAERERDEAVRVLRDIATFGWYAKGAKVARAYLAAREGR